MTDEYQRGRDSVLEQLRDPATARAAAETFVPDTTGSVYGDVARLLTELADRLEADA